MSAPAIMRGQAVGQSGSPAVVKDVSEPPDRPTARLPNRFTLDGDSGLESHLQLTCNRVLSGVRGIIPERVLEALVLGGGYGRGEGGVQRRASIPGDRPYNDLEFYVVARGNRHFNEMLYRRPLEVLGHILTHLAGIEVEFKIASLAELTAHPPSMFSYDLLAGHRLIWSADPNLIRLGPAIPAAEIPIVEATRLLMNRCTGLLLASDLLRHAELSPTEADFVARNIAKAELACGDAILTAHRQYHWSCRERAARLEALVSRDSSQWLKDVQRHHAAGVVFKLHPRPYTPNAWDLNASFAAIKAVAARCWLWIESERLGREFPTPRAYALDPQEKLPGTPRLRNLLMSVRLGSPRLRHPRERLFRALPLLLWESKCITDPDLRASLRQSLGRPVASFAEALTAYVALWQRVR